jgi:hypothetical protein
MAMAKPEMKIAPPAVDISSYRKPKPVEKVPAVKATVWKKDLKLTAAFLELATAETIELGEKVEVIPLNSNLLGDKNPRLT